MVALHESAEYIIRIQGEMDTSWSIDFGGVTVVPPDEPCQQAVTTITGEFVDQAALFGLLNRLYGLGFPLISVEYLAQPTGGPVGKHDQAQ